MPEPEIPEPVTPDPVTPEPVTVVYVTAPDLDVARAIARAVVEARLAACANILRGMESLYWWQGRLESAAEAVLLLKTTAALAPRVIARVRELHSYEVACAIALPVGDGNPPYLDWIRAETAGA